jgi:hypothetical protein
LAAEPGGSISQYFPSLRTMKLRLSSLARERNSAAKLMT